MDSDNAHLILSILDARKTHNTDAFARYLLRFLSTPDDGIVYSPESPISIIQQILGLKKSATYALLGSLEERKILCNMDKNSLQLNRQFSTKGSKPTKYEGSSVFISSEDQAFITDLYAVRNLIWGKRGKNKKTKYTKKIKPGDQDMQVLVLALTKQLDVKDKQIEGLLNIVQKISCGEQVSVDEAKAKLAMVYPIKK